jgi:hypothetical protein
MRSDKFVIAAALVALLLAATALWRQFSLEERFALSVECREQRDRCNQACQATHDQEMARISVDAGTETIEHSQRMIECNLRPDAALRLQCRTEEDARFNSVLAGLQDRRAAAEAALATCRQGCSDQADQCQSGNAPVFRPGAGGSIEIECIDAPGAPCFQKVSKLCTQIRDACKDCALTMCGDRSWRFESESLLTASLVGVVGPGDERTLATSKASANVAELFVPAKIELKPNEELEVRFTFSGGPSKNRKLTLRRSK